jgi:hypothetical protein
MSISGRQGSLFTSFTTRYFHRLQPINFFSKFYFIEIVKEKTCTENYMAKSPYLSCQVLALLLCIDYSWSYPPISPLQPISKILFKLLIKNSSFIQGPCSLQLLRSIGLIHGYCEPRLSFTETLSCQTSLLKSSEIYNTSSKDGTATKRSIT